MDFRQDSVQHELSIKCTRTVQHELQTGHEYSTSHLESVHVNYEQQIL